MSAKQEAVACFRADVIAAATAVVRAHGRPTTGIEIGSVVLAWAVAFLTDAGASQAEIRACVASWERPPT